MMKRFFVIFVVLALCLCMCACSGSDDTYVGGKLFERVWIFDDCTVYRNVDTNVLYTYYGGGFTAMFNADDTPQTWNGQ